MKISVGKLVIGDFYNAAEFTFFTDFYWSLAEPMTGTHETFRFCRTSVENHSSSINSPAGMNTFPEAVCIRNLGVSEESLST